MRLSALMMFLDIRKMKLNYQLTEEDYLQFCLFAASQNLTLRDAKRRILFLLILMFSLGSVWIYFRLHSLFFITFSVTGILYCIFYYFYGYRSVFKRAYKKNVKRLFKEKIGLEFSVVSDNELITILSNQTKLEINLANVDFIEEIADYYFIKLKTSDRIIIPKRIFENGTNSEASLRNFAKQNNITIKQLLDWKF